MFKQILTKLIKSRKRNFTLDSNIKQYDAFIILKGFIYLYGLTVLLHRINPARKCLFGRGVIINHRNKLDLGKSIKLGDGVLLDCLGQSGIKLGDAVSIGAFSRLIVSADYSNLGTGIIIEGGVGIGEFSRIGGSGGVEIGKDTIIGQYFSCHPENHIFSDTDKPIKQQGTIRKPIIIGEGCWIGSKVSILAGSIVGDNSVIAAGAVVNGEFPPYSVIGGVPAKIIKEIK